MTRIRQATAADAPAILGLAHRFIESTLYVDLLQFNPDALGALTLQALETGVIFLGEVDTGSLAGEDWQPVGMIAGVVEVNPISGDRMVSELVWWVNPEHAKTSLGPKLLRSMEEWTRHNACLCLKMVAPAGSTVGRFYERLGYSPIETAYVKRV